jgi:hypothetical protein
MENVTPIFYYEPPERKLFCSECDDIIENGEKYVDMNSKAYCMSCFNEWFSEHIRYNE